MTIKTDKKTRTKTTITKEIIQQVEELAKQGFNNILIGQSLNIATQTLSTNIELKEAIQRGKLELAKEVSQTVLDTLFEDNSMKQLLVKRLGLFAQTIDITKPKTAKEALDNLGTCIKLYSDNQISESQLKTIQSVSDSFIRGSEAIDLEERLTAIEKILKDKYEK